MRNRWILLSCALATLGNVCLANELEDRIHARKQVTVDLNDVTYEGRALLAATSQESCAGQGEALQLERATLICKKAGLAGPVQFELDWRDSNEEAWTVDKELNILPVYLGSYYLQLSPRCSTDLTDQRYMHTLYKYAVFKSLKCSKKR